MIALLLAVGATQPLAPLDTHYSWQDAAQAIRLVETGGCADQGRGAKGDGGNALGPFQIWKPYWTDAAERDPAVKAGSYARCLRDLDYSRLVVRAYMRRYCPEQMKRLESGRATLVDLERVARVHNGGPRGHLKKATLAYWAKIKKAVTR